MIYHNWKETQLYRDEISGMLIEMRKNLGMNQTDAGNLVAGAWNTAPKTATYHISRIETGKWTGHEKITRLKQYIAALDPEISDVARIYGLINRGFVRQ